MRKARRCLGYARVSSAEQAIGSSLQDQQDVIRSYARSRGLEVAKLYVEAESAVHENFERREQIQALLEDVRSGDLILVDKVDRWSRDPEFTYRSIREILSKDASFYAVGDQCDPSTPEGDTMLNFRILFAREEHKRIKQRLVGTRNALQNKGYFVHGRLPIGYRRANVKGAEKNILVIHEEEAARVRRGFEMCLEGYPTRIIAREVGMSQVGVNNMLRNRHYLGEMRPAPNTHWIKGRHPPIIDPATFASVQKALTERFVGHRPGHVESGTARWWLRDISYCAFCGRKMSAAYTNYKDGRRKHYLRCYARCTKHYVNVEKLENECEPIVADHLVELREMLANAEKTTKRAKPVGPSLEERRAKLNRRRLRYLEAFADGVMDRDELRAAMAKLDAERTRLDAEAHVPEPPTEQKRHDVLRWVDTIRKAWAKTDPFEKRKIVNGLAKEVAIAAGVVPRFTWFSAEELIRRNAK